MEELGIDKNQVILIKPGQVFDQTETAYNKTWIVHPVLVEILTNHIKTDWETQSHEWITIGEVRQHKLLPGFDKVLKAVGL